MVALVVRFSEEPVSTLAAILFIRLLKKFRSETFCCLSVFSLIVQNKTVSIFRPKKLGGQITFCSNLLMNVLNSQGKLSLTSLLEPQKADQRWQILYIPLSNIQKLELFLVQLTQRQTIVTAMLSRPILQRICSSELIISLNRFVKYFNNLCTTLICESFCSRAILFTLKSITDKGILRNWRD